MKAIKVTIEDIKELAKLMKENDDRRAKAFESDGYGGFTLGDKEALIDHYEDTIDRNIVIISGLLKVYVTKVLDMCYNLEYAEQVLNNKYNK